MKNKYYFFLLASGFIFSYHQKRTRPVSTWTKLDDG